MISTKSKGNVASSIFDQRTRFIRDQKRDFNIADVMHMAIARPEPVYEVGDQIRLKDGTFRRITFRTYSETKKTFLYRLTTTERNRFNGVISTGNIPEQEVVNMDKSDSLPAAADSHKVADKWIVQFKCQRNELFHTWINSDGEIALFERRIAIQFAQSMVMAYDSVKRWAVFRIRPYSGHQGEEWFYTLIQPDSKYTAAVSAFAEVQLSKIGLAGFYDDGFPIEYHHFDTGFLFLRNVIENWRRERVHDGRTDYTNPNRPKFNIGDLLKLPTKFIRPVQFITPYWIAPGLVGFRYWFYVRDKQLVVYDQSQLEMVYDVESVELDYAEPRPNLVKVVQADLAEEPTSKPDIECVLAKAQKTIANLEHNLYRCREVFYDIEKACNNLSVDINDDFSWIGYMASMGYHGGYYSDELKARFGLAPKPQHTIMIRTDEL